MIDFAIGVALLMFAAGTVNVNQAGMTLILSVTGMTFLSPYIVLVTDEIKFRLISYAASLSEKQKNR